MHRKIYIINDGCFARDETFGHDERGCHPELWAFGKREQAEEEG